MIPSPGKSPKDPLHGWQACPEFSSFHQGVGQISPREWLFSCRPLPKRGQICDIPAPPPIVERLSTLTLFTRQLRSFPWSSFTLPSKKSRNVLILSCGSASTPSSRPFLTIPCYGVPSLSASSRRGRAMWGGDGAARFLKYVASRFYAHPAITALNTQLTLVISPSWIVSVYAMKL